jgi:hypothetical protein
MGLRDFLDDIIPNELKGSLGKVAALGASAYFGYKYAPTVYKAAKEVIGQPGVGAAVDSGQQATGMFALAEKFKKYSDNPLVKFGKGVVGQTYLGKGKGYEEDTQGAQYLANLQALNARYTGNKFSSVTPGVGVFQTTQVRNPGFENARVQQGLLNMNNFMADLMDNGRIDSSSLYAEGPRGTTVKVGSAGLKSMKTIG